MEIIGKRFDLPLLVNVVEGGKTPVLTAEQYAEIGYQLAIYPAAGFLAVGHALNSVYATLKRTGASTELEVPIADFMTFSKAMGFEDVWTFEREHADLETKSQAAE